MLEGRAEQDGKRRFSFLVERVRDLAEALEASERVPEPRAVPSSGTFVRVGKRRGKQAV